MDLTTIASLFGNIKNATELARAIKDSGATLEQAEVKLKLADLVSALADVKVEAAEVRQALLDAEERIRELEEAAKLKANLKWRQPYYYRVSENGEEEVFCQPCFDKSSLLARLHGDGDGQFNCTVCKEFFTTSERAARDLAEVEAATAERRSSYF